MATNKQDAGAQGPKLGRTAQYLLLLSLLVTYWIGRTAMHLAIIFMIEAIKFPFALLGSVLGGVSSFGGRHYVVRRNGKSSWVSIWRY